MTFQSKGQYRREGSSLFELQGNAYIHVYANARLERAPIERLIAAYERVLDEGVVADPHLRG